MLPETKKATTARVLKIFALLLVILTALITFLLLFALLPPVFFGGDVQLDSGGFLDLLLRRTQHASSVLPALHVFLGALPLLLNVLLLLGESIVFFLFLKQVTKRNVWFFAAGKRYWIAAAVLGALIAVVPKLASIAVTPVINAGSTFAARPWNPLGDILLFAVILAAAVGYILKVNRLEKVAGGEEA